LFIYRIKNRNGFTLGAISKQSPKEDFLHGNGDWACRPGMANAMAIHAYATAIKRWLSIFGKLLHPLTHVCFDALPSSPNISGNLFIDG